MQQQTGQKTTKSKKSGRAQCLLCGHINTKWNTELPVTNEETPAVYPVTSA
jgi:hypothetical protein